MDIKLNSYGSSEKRRSQWTAPVKKGFVEDLDLKGWESFRLGEERRNPVLGRRTDLTGRSRREEKCDFCEGQSGWTLLGW